MVKSVHPKAGIVLLIDKPNYVIYILTHEFMLYITSGKKLLDTSIKTKKNLVAFKSIVRIAKQNWKLSVIHL